MQAFTTLDGLVMPLDRANVDTDAIIPKQYLKSIKRTGFGPTLFDDWRYLDPGEPGMDHSKRRPNPEFVLNYRRYQGAEILLARDNFGCGSSREHAPWALLDYGFSAIIAPSYADIFFNNCFKNGILPIVLEQHLVDTLFYDCEANNGYRLNIDLSNQSITTSEGNHYPFEVDAFRKQCLLQGLDDIDLTLQHIDEIREFEQDHRKRSPWLFTD